MSSKRAIPSPQIVLPVEVGPRPMIAWNVYTRSHGLLGTIKASAIDEVSIKAAGRWPTIREPWHVHAKKTVDLIKRQMRKPPMKEIRATAYHEAGHGVIGEMVNKRVLVIDINPQFYVLGGNTDPSFASDQWGEVQYEQRDLSDGLSSDERRRLCENQALSSIAGPMAQARFQGNEGWDWDCWDYAAACKVAEVALMIPIQYCGWPISEQCRNAYLEWLKSRTSGMLDFYWPLVVKVAAVLVEQRRMTGDQLRSIVAESLKDSCGTVPPDRTEISG